jgi:MFS family permease
VQGLVFFCQGFKIFLELSVRDLFKQYLNLEPNHAQFLTSVIALPWCFKIVYGLIADNLPIFGSHRRAYIMVNGLTQCFVMYLLSLHFTATNGVGMNASYVTVLLTVNALNSAFFNVVVNALMVAQSRRDAKNGSSDLQVYAWSLVAIGGILGSILSAYFTQYLTPRHSFMLCLVLSLGITCAGFLINKEIEARSMRPAADGERQTFCSDVRRNLSDIKQAMQIPQIYRALLFFLLCGLIVPSFGDIGYYFSLNVVHFSKFTVGILTLLGFATLLTGTMAYERFLKNYEVRKLMEWNILIGSLGCLISLIFAMRLNLAIGISDIAFVIVSSVITDTLSTAFSQLPVLVLFAKITPKNIEATVFALFTGVLNLSAIVISPNMGILINQTFVGVTLTSLSDYYKLVFIQMILSLVPLGLLCLIPMKDEIEAIQAKQASDAAKQDSGSSEETVIEEEEEEAQEKKA